MDNLEFCEFTLKRKHMLHPLLNSSILHSTLFLQLNWNKCSSVTTKKQTGKSHTKLLRTVAPAHIPPCLTGGVPALSSPETDEELPICKYRTSPLSSSTKLFALHQPVNSFLTGSFPFFCLYWTSEKNATHCTPASKARQVKDLRTLLLVCRRRQTSSDTKKSDVICRVILEGQKIHPARKSNHSTLCYCQRTGVHLTVWHYKTKAF